VVREVAVQQTKVLQEVPEIPLIQRPTKVITAGQLVMRFRRLIALVVAAAVRVRLVHPVHQQAAALEVMVGQVHRGKDVAHSLAVVVVVLIQ